MKSNAVYEYSFTNILNFINFCITFKVYTLLNLMYMFITFNILIHLNLISLTCTLKIMSVTSDLNIIYHCILKVHEIS